jgi:hypothetical protein
LPIFLVKEKENKKKQKHEVKKKKLFSLLLHAINAKLANIDCSVALS